MAIGDDRTDEDIFQGAAHRCHEHQGGHGPLRARYNVRSHEDVLALLGTLAATPSGGGDGVCLIRMHACTGPSCRRSLPIQRHGSVDQADVREGLREISQVFARDGVQFLGIRSSGARAKHPLEQVARLVHIRLARISASMSQKLQSTKVASLLLHAVRRVQVAIAQTVVHQACVGRLDGREYARQSAPSIKPRIGSIRFAASSRTSSYDCMKACSSRSIHGAARRS
ncbi:MAG: hypothetical protein IPM12_14910 [Flavobacteriales bacterium]|nr:hypothetical protein [Flavobacteriales bacterium]